MNIRAASEADMGVIRRQYSALLNETNEPEFACAPWPLKLEELRASMKDGLTLVAEANGRVLGFVEGTRKSGTLGWIENIYVERDSRRRGLARTLIEELSGRLAGIGRTHVGLEVRTSNGGARHAYERLGFKEFSHSLAVDVEALRSKRAATSVEGRSDPAANGDHAREHFL